jgi:outer membrane receptor protein involved in Fe transport
VRIDPRSDHRDRKGAALLRVAMLALLAPAACIAQLALAEADADAGVAASTTGGSIGKLQSVTVTATKRREDIKDIPTSVTAIDGEQLMEHHVSDYDDITRTVPGISFQAGAGPGLANIEMRGVSSTVGSATVGIYVDEVSVTVKNTYDGAVQPKLFDLDRIEVLRGPQGTLFGSSSMGGTIRFITKQPDLAKYSLSGGTDLSQTQHGGLNSDTHLIANVPVVDGRFAVRLGVDVATNRGYVDHYVGTATGIPAGGDPTNGNLLSLNTNDSTGILGAKGVNNDATRVLRLSARYKDDHGLTIDPSLLYQRTSTGDSGVYFPSIGQYQQTKRVAEPGVDTLLVPSLTINQETEYGDFTSVTSFFRRGFQRVADGTYYNSFIVASIMAGSNGAIPTTQSNPAQLSAINYQTVGVLGFLPSPVILNTITQQFSQELRFTSVPGKLAGMSFTGTGGLYVSNMHQEHTEYDPIIGINSAYSAIYSGNTIGLGTTVDTSTLSANPPAGGFPYAGVSWAGDISYFNVNHLNERQLAPFGEIALGLTDQMKLSMGLRYVTARQNFDAIAGGWIGYGIPSPYTDTEKYSATTPKVALDYAINPQVNVYASASKGFRLGGSVAPVPPPGTPFGTNFCDPDYASLGLLDGAPRKYDSDSLWSYEVGTKGRYLDNRVSVNAAAYAINWSNIQQQINLPTCGFSFIGNVGDARSLGVELELRAMVTDTLTLGLNGGTSNAYITRSNQPSAFSIGEKVLNVPEFTANLSADYDTELSDSLQFFARGDYAYTGEAHSYYNSSTVTHHYSPAYGVMNLSLGLIHGKTTFSLYAKNLLNNQKIIQYPSVNTVQEGYTMRPLTIGVTASMQM